MAKYTITDRKGKSREVTAVHKFGTVGEFVDFVGKDKKGFDTVVLRVRAEEVHTVERAEDDSDS